jgi:diguanylate cyclase (GGDEF)-like protein
MRPVAAALLAAALVGAPSPAQAAGEPVDVAGLAAEASQVVADERALLSVADPAVTDSPTQLAAAFDELARVDDTGAELLARMDAVGTTLSPEVRMVLALLPRSRDGAVETVARSGAATAPAPSVYAAALADLLDLAARPAQNVAPPDVERGVSLETLGMVALSFVALGLTGLLFTLRSARPRRELHAMAWSDGLTGLANRRRLDLDVDELRSGDGSPRSRHPAGGRTAVVMIDIDNFKDVNDRHGHRFGDEVLRAVGATLQREVRHDDVVYRYGGEEFCIVLHGATDQVAVRIADRVLLAARQLEFAGGVSVTLSAGVADGPGVDIERTLQAADEALLAAKRSGRDRTTSASAMAMAPSAIAICGT